MAQNVVAQLRSLGARRTDEGAWFVRGHALRIR